MSSAVKSVALVLVWILILAFSIYFFTTNVAVYLTGFRSKVFGDTILHNQLWVVMHLIGGSLALFLGPPQFWQSFRNRYLALHRWSGKIYMLGVALVGVSALRLSLISFCHPCRVSLFLLSVLALSSTAFAWKAILAKNVVAHRQFMIRSYICVLSFVAVRIDDVIPLDFFFGSIEDPTFRRTVNEYFFSFVPLLMAEICMTWLPAQVLIKWR